MSNEQKYYEMLTRTDHPVFKKDFAPVQDETSPFNSILNRVIARQLCKIRDEFAKVGINAHPNTVTDFSIDKWEETHFGFTKGSTLLAQRITELVDKVNNVQTMSLPDVILTAEIITGFTPLVFRNIFFEGWTLDLHALDVSTVMSGDVQADDAFTYVVIFSQEVDPILLDRLDKELTKIEKGGCNHVILAPPKFWTFDQSAFGVDTTLKD